MREYSIFPKTGALPPDAIKCHIQDTLTPQQGGYSQHVQDTPYHTAEGDSEHILSLTNKANNMQDSFVCPCGLLV